jgi:transposase-like protein
MEVFKKLVICPSCGSHRVNELCISFTEYKNLLCEDCSYEYTKKLDPPIVLMPPAPPKPFTKDPWNVN